MDEGSAAACRKPRPANRDTPTAAEEESEFQCVQTRWQMKTRETKPQEEPKENRRNASQSRGALRVALRGELFSSVTPHVNTNKHFAVHKVVFPIQLYRERFVFSAVLKMCKAKLCARPPHHASIRRISTVS